MRISDWSSDVCSSDLFRAINKAGRIWGDGMSPKVLWDVVRAAAANAGIEKLAPHDLRRTCARLCHLAGGELEQIQFLRSEERRVGKECVSQGRSRWSPYQ